MTERKYLPTFADLLDRLTITQMKAIFIHEHKDKYDEEREQIIHDLDLILKETEYHLTARDLHASAVLMLTNRFIWENESRARAGGGEQNHLLQLTHSINGVRNTAKNKLNEAFGERVDHKIDCFAADLIEQFGNWQVWHD